MPYKNNRNGRDDRSNHRNRYDDNESNGRPKASGNKDFKRPDKSFSNASGRGFSGSRDKDGTSSYRGSKPSRPFSGDGHESGGFKARPFGGNRERSFGRKEGEGSGERSNFRPRSDFGGDERRPYKAKSDFGGGERRPFRQKSDQGYGESKERRPFRPSSDRDKRGGFGDKTDFRKSGRDGDRDFSKRGERFDKPFRKRSFDDAENRKWTSEESFDTKPQMRNRKTQENQDGTIRLNRYIANAGICSRRKADELIEAGVISVNGEVISELGHKIDPAKDEIRYNGQLLRREKMVYVLLNKPKDYITTTDDPQERRTVMQLVEKASKERIYPVGRLDRNTTGLLLMTNDGDLAEKLSHPRNNITKIYQVELNRSLTQGDLNKISFGIELEDGLIKPDVVSYVQGGSKREIGIQIHSGKNRIVRRIFESLGYEVMKLDRVVYANLTKKDLPRGRWRYLDEKEIIQLKHFIK